MTKIKISFSTVDCQFSHDIDIIDIHAPSYLTSGDRGRRGTLIYAQPTTGREVYNNSFFPKRYVTGADYSQQYRGLPHAADRATRRQHAPVKGATRCHVLTFYLLTVTIT